MVTDINGVQRPDTCHENGVMVSGGMATVDIVWDNGTHSRGTPEALIRSSVQWRLYDEIGSSEEMAAALAFVETETSRRNSEKELAKARFDAEVEVLKSDSRWKFLDQENAKSLTGGARVAPQIRRGLKALFPEIKFSVKSDYNSVNVSWTDGPSNKEISEFVYLFKNAKFDGMDDCMKYNCTPWNVVFGGVEYICASRDNSDTAVEEAIDILFNCRDLEVNLRQVEKPCLREIRNNCTGSIPHLNLTVGEAVWAIVRARNKTNNKIIDNGESIHSWLLKLL